MRLRRYWWFLVAPLVLSACGSGGEPCDVETVILCKPSNVLHLFEFKDTLFSIGPFDFTRTVFLMFLAAAIVVIALFIAFRKPRVVPGKFALLMETLVGFVRNDLAIGTIGPEGVRYAPYLVSIFLFILVGNLFELVPGIGFPITARMGIPAMLALFTYLIFVIVGFAKNGFSYFWGIVWPKNVPIALRWLVGLIEFVSYFLLRPITLAVRLFANLVAGHLMLSLLLVSGYLFVIFDGGKGNTPVALVALAVSLLAFVAAVFRFTKGNKKQGMWLLATFFVAFVTYSYFHSFKPAVGAGWLAFGLGIYLFEFVVGALQAYIFTLLSAVYIQTSVHPEH